MNIKEKVTESSIITPIAYLSDLSGFKFIIKVNDQEKIYSVIVPPEYKIMEMISEDIAIKMVLESGYKMIDKKIPIEYGKRTKGLDLLKSEMTEKRQ